MGVSLCMKAQTWSAYVRLSAITPFVLRYCSPPLQCRSVQIKFMCSEIPFPLLTAKALDMMQNAVITLASEISDFQFFTLSIYGLSLQLQSEFVWLSVSENWWLGSYD